MNKKLVSAILCGAMVLAAATPVMADGGVADGKKIALVGKSAGNAFFEIAANSFKETVEAEGGSVDVVYPEAATADAQIKVLDNLISQKLMQFVSLQMMLMLFRLNWKKLWTLELKYPLLTLHQIKTAVRYL
mgnify:CR=1 FL=1